jgi:hypothetical protein
MESNSLDDNKFVPTYLNSNNKTKTVFVIIGMILLLVLIWWLIPPKSEVKKDSGELTPEQRYQALLELQETVSKSPPLTDKQRSEALEALRQTVLEQNK